MSDRPKIGLALSGGGARGLAHVGVLRVLTEAGIPIDYVAGTSAGALAGVTYCAGMSPDEMEHFAMQINWTYMARPTLSSSGLLSSKRLESWLKFILGDIRFCDLKTPLAIVATDLDSGKPVSLTTGRVGPAVRASCSVPGLFTPVTIDGRRLVDGGISDNLPIDVVQRMGAEYVIAVDLMEPHLQPEWGPLGSGIFSILTMIERSGGGPEEADCAIYPAVHGPGLFFDFRYRNQMLAAGEIAARQKLHQIESALAAFRPE
jgi:NTE family protein